MDPDIPKTGEIAPDFQILNSTGETFQLSSALKESQFLLLIFYRGHW